MRELGDRAARTRPSSPRGADLSSHRRPARRGRSNGEQRTLFTWFGMIGASRGQDGVGPRGLRELPAGWPPASGLASARISGSRAMRLTMSAVSKLRTRQPEEDVGVDNGIRQRASPGVAGVARLVLLHRRLAAGEDHALAVADDHVLALEAHAYHQVEAGDRRRTGARAHQLDAGDVLAHHLEPVPSMNAPATIAVPCWSSWNTGIFIRSRSLRST